MFFSIPNLSSNEVSRIESPWKTGEESPKFGGSKERHREWCSKPDTKHIFFSCTEGVNVSQRINSSNEPFKMWGFVADYDDPDVGLELEEVLARIRKLLPDAGLQPSFISSTFSKGVRMVWKFAEPVYVDIPEIREKFLKTFAKRVRMRNLCVGLDECSFDLSQYYERGADWRIIDGSVPVPTVTLDDMCITAAKTAGKLKAYDTVTKIPFETLEEELHKQYPGKWGDQPFTHGARGPMFWTDDTKMSSVWVCEDGVYCHSTRADRSFYTWKKLFGEEFVRAFEEKRISAAAGGIFYDGNEYYLPGNNGNVWRRKDKGDMLLHLKASGVSHKTSKDNTATEAEKVLHAIQESSRVDAVGPFLFNREKIKKYNGLKYLNTANVKPTFPVEDLEQGVPDNFPWLYEFLWNTWDDREQDGCHPRDFFLAWLQRAWEGYYTGEPKSGQVIVISGGPGRGKTLLGARIIRDIAGGGSDAGDFLLKGGGFNKELGNVPIWNVDDGLSASSYSNHKKFSEAIKKHVANPEIRLEPKFKDAAVVPWYGRIVITCNEDSGSLAILPDLDMGTKDKIMLFLFDKDYEPNFEDNPQLEEVIRRELPYFLAWLVQWKPPEGVLDEKNPRYLVKSYHHPQLLETAQEGSRTSAVIELLQKFRMALEEGDPSKQEVSSHTANELLEHLIGLPGGRSIIKLNSVTFGREMSLISREGGLPWLIKVKGNGSARYKITYPTKQEMKESE